MRTLLDAQLCQKSVADRVGWLAECLGVCNNAHLNGKGGFGRLRCGVKKMSAQDVQHEKQKGQSVPDQNKRQPLVVKTVSDFRAWRAEAEGKVALVPTMGALHEGHVSLIKRGRELGKQLAVWIFVNPLQFGPKEDFGSYPRTFEQDLETCAQAGVDVIFSPSVEEIYPDGKDKSMTVVPNPELGDVLEGTFRPGFFTGVATVVAKFFNIMQPHVAMFGEKDYQQLMVIRRMVQDLNLPIAIEALPIVRAEDGLALSSRNAYLSSEQRKKAPLLYQSLKMVEEKIRSGSTSVEDALAEGRAKISACEDFSLQYLEARDSRTFAPQASAKDALVVLVAAKLSNVRLIDNVVVRA
jgi:pantoate--beta-alanine ligase